MPISNKMMELELDEEDGIITTPNPIQQQNGSSSNTMSLEDKFKAAVKVIHSLPKDGPYQPSTGTKLKFYGLFKQATEGPTNVGKPAFWDVVGKYKWEAWKELGQLSKEDAMIKYIESLKDIVETMSWDGNVQDFLNTIGPFYEFVNLQGSEMSHVKDTIDRLTSSSSGSSSSSSTSSIVPSPANSAANSPHKRITCNDSSSTGSTSTTIGNEEIGDTDEVQLLVESRTATYETNSYAKSNGAAQKVNGYHHPFPPPTPQHTYSRKSSLANQLSNSNGNGALQEQEEAESNNDEVINILTSNGEATCQADLEENDPPLPAIRLGILENNTCSGTESEKYYSGDSEPEEDPEFDVEPRFKGYSTNPNSIQRSLAEETPKLSSNSRSTSTHNLPVSKSTSMSPCSCANPYSTSSHSHKASSPSTSVGVVSRNRKTSPKQQQNIGLNGFTPASATPTSGELILSSSVERLNRDVDHIVARLRILETAYASSVDEGGRVRRRHFFGGLSPSAIAFLVMWPFAVTFLLKVMGWWWSRRKRGILSLARRSLQ